MQSEGRTRSDSSIMDAYEATRIVFSRLQDLDPENAYKIMGLLLLQEHGEKEVIRLAFGPDSLLHSLILKIRKELGLAFPSFTSGSSPFGGGGSCGASPFLRQNSATHLLPGELPLPLAANSPSSWAAPRSVFSSFSSAKFSGSLEELQNSDELLNPSIRSTSHFYGCGGDLTNEFDLADQLSFLGGPIPAPNCNHPLSIGSKPGDGIDVFHPETEYNSSNGISDGPLFPCGTGWRIGYHHRLNSSAVADLCHGDNAPVLGWEPCHYFARGYCKNGTACRFLHGFPEEALAVGTNMDSVPEKQYEELQLRSKSLRNGSASQFMVSEFPCSPTASVLPHSLSPLSKNLSFLLQLQQNESQRAAAAAATVALTLGADRGLKFVGRSRSDLLGNPCSRQIYLTFPADSTFREEDVSNYFSIYGPVQDVRIPYQQKRMFGFVTFLYPETVKLILAKGNPHFVCYSRVLVKPYKEKGKVPDKKLQQSESRDFSVCTSPAALDAREVYDLNQLGARMLNNTYDQELLLRRKLELQQAAELQRAIELQGRRFMGLQLLDLKNRSLFSAPASINSPTFTAPQSISNVDWGCSDSSTSSSSSLEESPTEDKSISDAAATEKKVNSSHGPLLQHKSSDKEESVADPSPTEDSYCQPSLEHNLPDNPFSSATKSSFTLDLFPSDEETTTFPITSNGCNNDQLISSTLPPATASLDMPSFSSHFFQMPRYGT